MMNKSIVQFSFRQFMGPTHSGELEKAVRKSSYDEFLLKSQAYNPEGKYQLFSEMVAADGRANSLHYKTGFAVESPMQKYRNQIPVLKDHSGKTILFLNHRFELIESDISDFSRHEVAVHYHTDFFICWSVIGNSLVLSPANNGKDTENFYNCLTLDMSPALSVIKIGNLREFTVDLTNGSFSTTGYK